MPRKSKPGQKKPSRRWVILRKTIQTFCLVIFIIFFLKTAPGIEPASWASLPMRLDPLLMLSQFISSRTFLAWSLVAFITIFLTVIFGRVWCGWICPLGTILDILQFGKPKPRKVSDRWRSLKYFLLLVILFLAIFGNVSLLITDPLTIFYRTLVLNIWPLMDRAVTGIERLAINYPPLSEPIFAFDSLIRPNIFPLEPVHYPLAWFFGLIFLGMIGLNFIVPRFWCRYLCPLGGLLGLISKGAVINRQVKTTCKGCKLCTQSCPTGTINPELGYSNDPAECTVCLECLDICPRNSISFTSSLGLSNFQNYDPDRRKVITSFAVSLTAFTFLRLPLQTNHLDPNRILPPGSDENTFLSKCIRCAECVRICPTSGLKPSITESGLEGFWSPVLTPRHGYCDYSCHMCGEICPVQAIPNLTLEQKRLTVIGKAQIDKDRCLAWTKKQPCIVCEEMCPLPQKAIRLEESVQSGDQVKLSQIQLPAVIEERCIGCGICEYKCPLEGEAAIRVYSI